MLTLNLPHSVLLPKRVSSVSSISATDIRERHFHSSSQSFKVSLNSFEHPKKQRKKNTCKTFKKSGVGLTVPKLLPTTGTWVAPFTLYYVLLSSRVVGQRIRTDHYIGDRPATSTYEPGYDPLEIASRCQVNFIENVPLAFILLGVSELNGGNRKGLNYAMAVLFALRLAHSEGGLRLRGQFGGCGVGRPYFGTSGVLIGLAGYAAYLTQEYWGF